MLTENQTARDRNRMDRLVNRRDRLMARIRTIEAELRQLQQNPALDENKGERERSNLLSYLSGFHRTEIDQIDSALHRLAMGEYGLCLACKGPIEVDWLDSFPEAEFCSICYRIRERMTAG